MRCPKLQDTSPRTVRLASEPDPCPDEDAGTTTLVGSHRPHGVVDVAEDESEQRIRQPVDHLRIDEVVNRQDDERRDDPGMDQDFRVVPHELASSLTWLLKPAPNFLVRTHKYI